MTSGGPVPDRPSAPAATARLTVTSEPSPLVITLLDSSMVVAARGVSPSQFTVAPGLYVVTASRPGQDDFRTVCWAVAATERRVHLSASAPRLINRFTGFAAQIGDQYVRRLKTPELVHEALAAEDTGKVLPFSIRFLRLYDWNCAQLVAGPKFSATATGTRTVLDIVNPETSVILAQLRGGGPVRNVALPPAAPNKAARFSLVVDNTPDDLVVRVRLSTTWAESVLQYMVQGYLEQAKLVVSGLTGTDPAASAADPTDDIAATLVPRYLGLRLSDPAIFNTPASVAEGMDRLTDGLVLTAELAARNGRYRSSANTLLRIAPGAMPLFTEGFSLMLQRLRDLVEIDNDDLPPDQQLPAETRAQLREMAKLFGRWGAFIDLSSPTVVFPGIDPARPSRRSEAPDPLARPLAQTENAGWTKVGESIFASVKGVFNVGEGGAIASGPASVSASWPELGPLSTGTGTGFPIGLTREIEDFVALAAHSYRFNSRSDTALTVAGIVLSVAIVAAGVYNRSDLSTILGALVAAVVTAQRAFPFNQRWQFYRTLLSQGQNLATKARTGAITPEEALAALGTLRLDLAQQIPRGNTTASETNTDRANGDSVRPSDKRSPM